MRFQCGSASRTSDGSLIGGDMVAVDDGAAGLGVVVVDVAGSGWSASRDAWRTRDAVDAAARLDPVAAVIALHGAMSITRGAVAVAARFETSGMIRYAGVGDVRIGRWRDGSFRHFPIPCGQLGVAAPTVAEQAVLSRRGDVYTVVTDGIRSSMDMSIAIGELRQPPAEIAAAVLDRWSRHHDDATCVVVIAG